MGLQHRRGRGASPTNRARRRAVSEPVLRVTIPSTAELNRLQRRLESYERGAASMRHFKKWAEQALSSEKIGYESEVRQLIAEEPDDLPDEVAWMKVAYLFRLLRAEMEKHRG